eukprot:TRINITY_DN8054_c0_g1_i3.p1 TRINITY_DN8054_c0_g1~~TRINITY_DN8054_c0_g1_i3.p1  ORF type:complete len:619 (+),score=62.01 TRINITY_DN8054_c0_g1_i3:67-1923(+)
MGGTDAQNGSHVRGSSEWLVPRSSLPLFTRGHSLVGGENGVPVVLNCVNWYGMHLEQLVANGLNKRELSDIVRRIVEMRFNCVRLPYSLDLFLGQGRDPWPPEAAEKSLAANPALQSLTPLEIFDKMVEDLTAAGLVVILNDHTSSAKWCCSETDGEGLWYTKSYNESVWLENLHDVAERYRENPLVAGFDLRNEIRATRVAYPTWGTGIGETDWAMAAVKGARRVLEGDPDQLIIVSGLSYSMFLCNVTRRPIHVEFPELRGRIVYTAHEYSWYNSDLSYFHDSIVGMVEEYCTALLFCLSLLLTVGVLTSLATTSLRRQCLSLRYFGLQWTLCAMSSLIPRSGASIIFAALLAFATTLIVYVGIVRGASHTDPCRSGNYFGGELWICFYSAAALSLLAWCRLLLGIAHYSVMSVSRSVPRGRNTSADFLDGIELVGARQPEITTDAAVSADHSEQSERKLYVRPQLQSLGILGIVLGGASIWTALGQSIASYHTYETFAADLDARWGFMTANPLSMDGNSSMAEERVDVAPVWVGEFGTDWESDWWVNFVRYLRERPVVGWAYWPLNGEKRTGEAEWYGILEEDMETIRHPWKLAAVQELFDAKLAASEKLAQSGL